MNKYLIISRIATDRTAKHKIHNPEVTGSTPVLATSKASMRKRIGAFFGKCCCSYAKMSSQ